MDMVVERYCPSCQKEYELKVDGAAFARFQANPRENIQKIMPDVNSFVRESLITGFCFDCQEKFFNRPAPGHEEAWGPQLTECPQCGCSIYEKDMIDSYIMKCPSCHFQGDPNED